MHQVRIYRNIKIREEPDDDAAGPLSLRNASGFPIDLAFTLGLCLIVTFAIQVRHSLALVKIKPESQRHSATGTAKPQRP